MMCGRKVRLLLFCLAGLAVIDIARGAAHRLARSSDRRNKNEVDDGGYGQTGSHGNKGKGSSDSNRGKGKGNSDSRDTALKRNESKRGVFTFSNSGSPQPSGNMENCVNCQTATYTETYYYSGGSVVTGNILDSIAQLLNLGKALSPATKPTTTTTTTTTRAPATTQPTVGLTRPTTRASTAAAAAVTTAATAGPPKAGDPCQVGVSYGCQDCDHEFLCDKGALMAQECDPGSFCYRADGGDGSCQESPTGVCPA